MKYTVRKDLGLSVVDKIGKVITMSFTNHLLTLDISIMPDLGTVAQVNGYWVSDINQVFSKDANFSTHRVSGVVGDVPHVLDSVSEKHDGVEIIITVTKALVIPEAVIKRIQLTRINNNTIELDVTLSNEEIVINRHTIPMVASGISLNAVLKAIK